MKYSFSTFYQWKIDNSFVWLISNKSLCWFLKNISNFVSLPSTLDNPYYQKLFILMTPRLQYFYGSLASYIRDLCRFGGNCTARTYLQPLVFFYHIIIKSYYRVYQSKMDKTKWLGGRERTIFFWIMIPSQDNISSSGFRKLLQKDCKHIVILYDILKRSLK